MASATFAQENISGYVEDSLTHSRLANVSVTLLRNGKPLKFTRSKEDGTFTLAVAEKQANDMLQATYMGYKKQKAAISSGKETIISMVATAFVLKEVQVKGSRITGRDTISFDLTRFANERDNNLKDVLKKLPGVDIEKNGRINYNGKPINRFTVEGLDLTGGKYNQLEENIKAKDVKKAEIIEHDQPIKALQNKTFTDNVAMNIALKDSARGKLLHTIKPYLLVGSPTHVGGKINTMQIGKKKQMIYDVAYDRTGENLGYSLEKLASYSDRLAAATLPSWHSVPILDAPIDDERLRFNTTQKYSISHVKKNKQDAENHHGVSDLYVNDDCNRLRTNLWHTAHTLSWQKNRYHWAQQYQLSLDANNIHINSDEIGGNSLNLTGKFTPFWQYKTETFRISFSPDFIWERFTYPPKTLWTVSPVLYLNKQMNFRNEMTAYIGYNTSTGSSTNYTLSSYRRSYRSWYMSNDIIPITHSLFGKLSYDYKRPIKEIFLSVSLNANRYWMNTASDLRIVDGNYYTSLYKQNSKSDNIGGSLYISKGFYELNLKTRLTVSYNYSKGEQYSSGKAIDYTANTYTLKPSIDFSPSWCAFSYEGEFTKYDSKRQKQAVSSLFDWKQTLSATATINHIDLTFSLVHYHNELQGGSKVNTLLGDASVVWRMKKLRLSAELRNIFNKKNYVKTVYSGISTQTDSYHLRPRELMITTQYSF